MLTPRSSSSSVIVFIFVLVRVCPRFLLLLYAVIGLCGNRSLSVEFSSMMFQCLFIMCLTWRTPGCSSVVNIGLSVVLLFLLS